MTFETLYGFQKLSEEEAIMLLELMTQNDDASVSPFEDRTDVDDQE